MEDYSSIPQSVLQLIVILAGKVQYTKHIEADEVWAGFFIISFTMVNTLVLLNVLNAIIIISYKEIKHSHQNSSTSKINFFKNLLNIVSEAFIIYINTASLYTQNISCLADEIMEECQSKYDGAIKDFNDDVKSGKLDISVVERIKNWLLHVVPYLLLTSKYINDVIKRIDCITTKTYEAIIYKNWKDEELIKHTKNKENEKGKSSKNKQNQSKEEKEIYKKKITYPNKITSKNEISVGVKMIAYIWSLVEDNFNNPEFASLRDIFIKPEIDVIAPKNEKIAEEEKKQAENAIDEEDKEDMNLDEDNKANNEWFNEFKDKFEKIFLAKGNTFFKPNIFTKDLVHDLSMSKELTSQQKMTNYLSIFQIEPMNRDHFFNLNFDPPCHICMEKKQDVKAKIECELCWEITKKYESIYVLIYDLLVKYFYLPDNMSSLDKEIYIGYYFTEFKKTNKDLTEYNHFVENIPEQKTALFENEIIFFHNKADLDLWTMEKFNELKKHQGIIKGDEKKNFEYLTGLYKFFVIWNSLYLFLFKKIP